ncbi:Aminodeoxyfutalosine synthase [Candidatus Xiphinematobacter sp. Idaho Grape]|uniref:aminofutalosine synthase MqnE n=1 Tax=Candidatus Xiphinematobacter sp. Idaho Grape TaxID=1704307 RepID=UPI00070603F1|nr:aminofutalosine synthase MqnE [Candidatus Xiphinematobacter sp. Idaho Grape]ALJ56616.1 Aminodeoxyfutalosine synthase [Candidatus Xiphinematobacter sp. Idaho Grape]
MSILRTDGSSAPPHLARQLRRVISSIVSPELRPILKKVENGRRISQLEGKVLYRTQDLNGLGAIADLVRERKNGNFATYLHNRYINYSNVCILSCQFCAFGAKKQDAHAFETSIQAIVQNVQQALSKGITEVHMVGGLHPTLRGEWYLELLSSLRGLSKILHIKAFTAVEIRHLARRVFHLSIQGTLQLLREHGLDSITGGGAEIFDSRIRRKICHAKESAEEWLEVHRTWHQMGGKSTSTMLYGHIETHAQRIAHLEQLRALQDETGGFTGFIPFAFVPNSTAMAHVQRISATEELKNLAISRIYLDNFEHITAYWVSLGLPVAQLSLSYGVDDLHGTIMEEKIFHMAGAVTPQEQTVTSLRNAIREAGRVPIERDSLYRHIDQHQTV